MKSIKCLMLGAMLLMALCGTARATIIDFEGASDGVTETGRYIDIGEYRFTLNSISNGSLFVLNQSDLIESDSTKLFVINHSEVTLSRIDGEKFDLDQFDIGGSWEDLPERWAAGVNIIAGTKSTTVMLPTTSTYKTIQLDFDGVTSVLFSPLANANNGPGNYEFDLDNINVNATPVPEPSTVFLFGAGLAGLVLYKKRKSA